MLYCPKCGKEISIKERHKGINKTILECSECNSKYKMKYLKIFLSVQSILIVLFGNDLDKFIPETNFLVESLIKVFIIVIVSYVIFFILSIFMKYEKIEESEGVD